VVIDSSELENLSEEQLRAKYNAASRGAGAKVPGSQNNEDYSDMIAKETAARKKQRTEKQKSKEKEYKF